MMNADVANFLSFFRRCLVVQHLKDGLELILPMIWKDWALITGREWWKDICLLTEFKKIIEEPTKKING